ncbi:MAG: RidA family protein [Micrococcales bacterium]|nr:RidA family protein [Micrococcales bacterium]
MTRVHVVQGPWSTTEALIVGTLIFLSGTTAKNVDGTYEAADSMRTQVDVVLDRVQERLRTAGVGLQDVVKLVVYLRDIADLPTFDCAYLQRFQTRRPARTTVQAGGFEDGAWLELDVVAVESTAVWDVTAYGSAPTEA